MAPIIFWINFFFIVCDTFNLLFVNIIRECVALWSFLIFCPFKIQQFEKKKESDFYYLGFFLKKSSCDGKPRWSWRKWQAEAHLDALLLLLLLHRRSSCYSYLRELRQMLYYFSFIANQHLFLKISMEAAVSARSNDFQSHSKIWKKKEKKKIRIFRGENAEKS